MERKSLFLTVTALTASLSLALLPTQAQTQSNDVYQAVVKCEFGTAVAEMEAIEKIIHEAKPADYPAIEKRLIGILEAPGATMPGRQFALRMLRFVGSVACIPSVSKLLQDKDLAHMARNVFVGLDGKAFDAALKDAVAATQGASRAGIINTMGDRKDSSSLKMLSKLLKESDDDTALAIINALGKIGGAEAADELDKFKPSDALKPAWSMAYLRCAEGLTAENEIKRTQKMYKSLIDGAFPSSVRAGAMRAVVIHQKEAAVPMVMEHLASSDELMKRAAMSAVIDMPGHPATLAFVQQMETAKPETKSLLINQLSFRGDAEGVTGPINKLVSDSDTGIREAAIQALQRIGDASSVAVLAALLKDQTVGELARQTLISLNGKGVPEAMIQLAETGDPAVRVSILELLSDRKQASALPAARKALTDSNPDVRQAGLKIIAKTGEQPDIKLLCDSLLACKDNAERERFARTVSAVGTRIQDKSTRCDAVVESFAKADAQAKTLLVTVLASLGGDKALAAARTALTETGDVHKAAVRALAEWNDASPVADLRKAAKEDSDEATKIIALRGFIKMIGTSSMKDEEKIQAYEEAVQTAARPEEKIQALAGVANIAKPESLKVIAPCLTDEKLKREAFLAYEKVAETLIASQQAVAREALQKVVTETNDDGLRKKANEAIKKIK